MSSYWDNIDNVSGWDLEDAPYIGGPTVGLSPQQTQTQPKSLEAKIDFAPEHPKNDDQKDHQAKKDIVGDDAKTKTKTQAYPELVIERIKTPSPSPSQSLSQTPSQSLQRQRPRALSRTVVVTNSDDDRSPTGSVSYDSSVSSVYDRSPTTSVSFSSSAPAVALDAEIQSVLGSDFFEEAIDLTDFDLPEASIGLPSASSSVSGSTYFDIPFVPSSAPSLLCSSMVMAESKSTPVKISPELISAARVARVEILSPMDALWQKHYFALAVNAIEQGNIDDLKPCIGPPIQFYCGQIKAYAHNVDAQMELYQNRAIHVWLEHFAGHIEIYNNNNYPREEFEEYVDSMIEGLAKKFIEDITKQQMKLAVNRANYGALIAPDDVRERYLEHLAKLYKQKLTAAKGTVIGFLTQNHLLDKKLTDSDKAKVVAKRKTVAATVVALGEARKKKRKALAKMRENARRGFSQTVSASVPVDIKVEELPSAEVKTEAKVDEQVDLEAYVNDGKIQNFNVFHDKAGNTLMHYALKTFVEASDETVRGKQLAIIEMLFKAGLSPFVANSKGENAFQFAVFDKTLEALAAKYSSQKNQIATSFWQVVYWSGDYMVSPASGYARQAVESVSGYASSAKANLASDAHWWLGLHDWHRSNVSRLGEVIKIYGGVHVSDRDFCDARLEEVAKEVMQVTTQNDGLMFKSILGRKLNAIIEGRDKQILLTPRRQVDERDAVVATGVLTQLQEQAKIAEKKAGDEAKARIAAEEAAKKEKARGDELEQALARVMAETAQWRAANRVVATPDNGATHTSTLMSPSAPVALSPPSVIAKNPEPSLLVTLEDASSSSGVMSSTSKGIRKT